MTSSPSEKSSKPSKGVKAGEVKAFSEQGYKVWRARVTGVTAEAAGDSANPPKKSKKETETVEA